MSVCEGSKSFGSVGSLIVMGLDTFTLHFAFCSITTQMRTFGCVINASVLRQIVLSTHHNRIYPGNNEILVAVRHSNPLFHWHPPEIRFLLRGIDGEKPAPTLAFQSSRKLLYCRMCQTPRPFYVIGLPLIDSSERRKSFDLKRMSHNHFSLRKLHLSKGAR